MYLIDAWEKSNFTKTYIGEWHTHPTGLAVPSDIDKRTWRKIVMRTKRPMIFAISTPIELKFFLGCVAQEKKKDIILLIPIVVGITK